MNKQLDKISVFGGSGFVGSKFIEMYPDSSIRIERNSDKPESKNILYFISTIDNYNVYTDPFLDINTNLIKLIKVLEECKKENNPITFNFISSWFVYGKTNDLPAKEDSICNPFGFYSITKYAAEKMLVSYCSTFNINYRILRLCNIIGKEDKKVSKKKNALQFMINRVIMNEPVDLYDAGSPIRDYMHVEDCCRALKLCLDEGEKNTVYNISNCNPITIKDAIDYVKQKIKSTSQINSIHIPDFHKNIQVKDMWLDNSKLIKLGYSPSMTVYEAINTLLEEKND